jgi:2-polyprenyl-3-methyl-5-hydroxy-6-metoxy-1,4-benzoquinol methylase
MNNKCSICENNQNNNRYILKEMMFGFDDLFEYFQCGNCGCLQIKEIPENIGKYYPDNYYSFDGLYKAKISKPERYFRHRRLRNYLYKKNSSGKFFEKIFGNKYFYEWLKIAGISEDSNILDVGCGNGQFLINLYNEGFNRLIGVDTFFDHTKYHFNNIKILKKDIYDIDSGKFDFITLNHSLEHMKDHFKVFNRLNELLSDDGTLLIRVPVVGYAWRKYGANWIELDPPRHFIIHSKNSLNILAASTGFEIIKILHDSTALEIWGSIQAQNNIPYRSNKSYLENPNNSIFSPNKIKSYTVEINKLNESGESGRVCFFLKKTKSIG